MKLIKLTGLFLLYIFSYSYAHSQTFGAGLGFGTSNSMIIDFFYEQDFNRYYFGMTYEFADTKGKFVTEQLSNYGLTIEGRGT